MATPATAMLSTSSVRLLATHEQALQVSCWRTKSPQNVADTPQENLLLGLMKVLDAEYAWLDVQTVSPGYTETPMLDAFDPRFLDQMRAALPAGEFSSPDSVAAEILNAIQGR